MKRYNIKISTESFYDSGGNFKKVANIEKEQVPKGIYVLFKDAWKTVRKEKTKKNWYRKKFEIQKKLNDKLILKINEMKAIIDGYFID